MTKARTREEIVEDLLFYPLRGLDGYLPRPLRGYSFSFDQGEKTIWIKAEVDRELNEDEREALSIAETELYSAEIFGWADREKDTMIHTLVSVVPVGQPLDPLPAGIAFLRAGERVPEGYVGAPPHPRAIVPGPPPDPD